MAIEFNCPYCTATIRVADAYAGKQGRCPKCDTRLVIPSVRSPNQPAAPEPSSPVEALAGLPFAAGQTPIAPPGPMTGEETPFAPQPLVSSVAKSRRRRVRRRPSRALVIGVPVICFLVLFGIIAFTVTSSLPKLHGELTGRPLDGMMLPKSRISWSELSLNEDDRRTLQNSLRTQPEALASQIIVCRLSADNDGIIVTLSTQPESQWIAVDISAETPLALWRKREGPPLNRYRLDELSATAMSYAREKLKKINGQLLAIDAVAVRDGLALNAGGGALSYAVEAVADSIVFPCAAEDPQGKLYFCLPKTVRSFVIQGRIFADGRKGFTGDYTVTIAKKTVTTETETDAADGNSISGDTEGESKMEEGMSDKSKSEMDGEKSESMEKMSPDMQGAPTKSMMNDETMKDDR
ncbi:MAG TPA: hypothetical protein PLY87_03080 [Planctomycetaceae bacterium]|nr:hypothetical protein [Planctomycetaceae bacterium]